MNTQKTSMGDEVSEAKKDNKKVEKLNLPSEGKYIAKKGCNLPVFHAGKIIHISDDKPVELKKKSLSYESQVEVKRALAKELVKLA